MAIYLEEKLELYINSVWVEITSDVVEDIESQYGIQGDSPTDRVASTGDFIFTLNNATGKYSPDSSDSLSGFTIGIPVRYTLYLEDLSFVKFYGKISKIKVDSGMYGSQRTYVTALDWMNIASGFRLQFSSIERNKRIDEAVQIILSQMPIQPLDVELHAGDETFPTVFDDATPNSSAMTEFVKLALSEMGWIFLKRDRVSGETLVVQGKTYRDSLSLTKIPFQTYELIETENDDYIVTTDDETILLSELKEFQYDNLMTTMDSEFGANVINRVIITSHPRRVDSSVQVLYSTSERIFLRAGESKSNLRVQYKDPSGGAIKVNADPDEMITPVSGTDFTMTANADGTGANLTSDLSVTASFDTDVVTFSLENSGSTDGYAYVQFRGIGVYVQDPIEFRVSDDTSIDFLGIREVIIKQRYLSDTDISAGIANATINVFLNPQKDVKSFEYIANVDTDVMNFFLYSDIGDKLSIKETKTGVDADYFIQRIKFTVLPGGVVFVKVFVVPGVSVIPISWLLEIDGRTELDETTIVGYE